MDGPQLIRRTPAPALRGHVGSYYGFVEETPAPMRRHEDPGGDVLLVVSWSRKRLRARFREQVGLPPKALARVLRFERAVELAGRRDGTSWAEVAFDCGYYDQSHLINEFRAISGRTPGAFSKTPPSRPRRLRRKRPRRELCPRRSRPTCCTRTAPPRSTS